MNIQQKVTIKIRQFFESKVVGVNKLFAFLYSDQENNSKRYEAKQQYLPKRVIKNYNVIINGKNFYDHPINSDIKQYEETRKLTIGQGKDYTAECLLDYYCIKVYYRLIAVDLS